MSLLTANAIDIVHAVRSGRTSAVDVVRETLAAVRDRDAAYNCFTGTTAERALQEARAIDAKLAAGQDPGPLAGVPYAVKNLFDVEGVTTLAGSKINADLPPAAADATAVRRLRDAGAVLVGMLNMDEYAYGFTTENTHYGPVRNPHDLNAIAGGSSGGSAAAVASGLVPLTLGSDTNGSVRLPSALCGTFGIKPTFGRVSRAGTFPLAPSLDTVGAFARSVDDLAACYDAMLGPDHRDRLTASRAAEPVTGTMRGGIDGLRIAVAGDYFEHYAEDDVLEAVAEFARLLGATRRVTLEHADKARAAAYVITAVEAGNIHLPNLQVRQADFEPRTVNRLIAGAIAPAAWYVQAQRFRQWFRDHVNALFSDVDVILAPAAPRSATPIGAASIKVRGHEMAPRAYMGMLTQPISFIGLPTITVPYVREGAMPLGVQVIARPWREDLCFRVAHVLEQAGIARSPIAPAASAASR
ncbi:AtzE family amidohydrolase [Noviherbaspirillum galbum]|uniref:AtzE family amidohydrolase n=1 Tax=Noviherbaspirillum galbum TaxID=2709383 RepID=A0A6B3SIU9_9BURK|nr:AtzE family amidohydrolase [Noviherbaspirillum galbum]NEX60784.1 AtzE family amidohydrolase [Noviherbaspirillum galbum]